MQYRKLGLTGLDVSLICLGTMTWGEQNTETEAHQQLDFALDHGVNFIDTAEMYPVPPKAETCGKTEEYIGTWLEKTGNRDKVILASKVAGRVRDFYHIREGQTRLDRENILEALEGSLRRLRTDYLDLYQLHWPDRAVNMFGQLGYKHDADDNFTPPFETLEVLDEIVKSGKVRYVGLSNETPWGVMEFDRLACERNWPHMQSIQNPYSLLNRSFEIGLAEIAIRENIGLLAYSPLGFGMLSGKYLGGNWPEGARLTLFERFGRYRSQLAFEATRRYVEIARRYGFDPAQMALAFVNRQPFVTSNIIGATNLEQLDSNIRSINLILPKELLAEIDAVHAEISNPCP